MSWHLDEQPPIPDDSIPVAPAHRPTWWTVRTVRYIAFMCAGLAVALSLVSTLVSWRSAEAANARAVEVERRLAALEEYVAGRGEYRDRETERLQGEIRDGICDLLDQLPPSPLLDVPRGKYSCGPGASPGLGTPQQPTAATPSPLDAGTSAPSPARAADDPEVPSPTPAEARPSSPADPLPGLPPSSSPSQPPAPPAAPEQAPGRGPIGALLCALPLLC